MKMTEDRWETIMRFFDKVIKDSDKFSDKAIVLALGDEEITKIFTKERLKLIRIIKGKKIINVTQLSKIVKRDLTAVERDLKILESFGIVKLEKIGKDVRPSVEKEVLILPLMKLEPIRIEKIK